MNNNNESINSSVQDVIGVALQQIKDAKYRPTTLIMNDGRKNLTAKDLEIDESILESFQEIASGGYKIIYKSAIPDHG